MVTDAQGRSGINAFDLTGKVAAVTGSGRGLGQAVALALSSANAKVTLGSRDPAHLQETVTTITKNGGAAHSTTVDITSPDQCVSFIRETIEAFNRLDILVCNAASNIQNPAAEMTPSEWRQVIETEMSGFFYLCKAAHPVMKQQGKGSIIMISANSSLIAYIDLVGVATAKGGVDMMARNLAAEWGPDGIRVNTINPGWTEHVPPEGADVSAGAGDLDEDIRTMTPLQRRGRLEEFGFPAIFLASDASSYVTGHNLVVDGGYSIR